MKKKIFFQIFAVAFFSVILMFVFGIIAVNVNAKTMMKERLQEETLLACSLIETQNDFQNFAKYENDDAFRITITDLNGDVLYETDTKSPLENHANREEIKFALSENPQTVERYSETFGCVMTYYAVKTTLLDGSQVVFRLAIKNSQLDDYYGFALPILCVVMGVLLVASLIVSNLLSKKLSNKIIEVGISLKSLNAGDYQPIKSNSSEPELFSVLNQINELNESTLKNIQKVQEEHAKLNVILENVSQGIIAVDENKNIVFANKSGAKIFNCDNSITGKSFIFLIDDVSLCEKITKHLGENYQGEYSYKNKELSVVIRKIDVQNEFSVSSIIIITDITSEKAVQKQKSDFFANASHELKTPVTVMQGLSEILLDKQTLDESSKKQIDRINKESIRLSSLISDMLKLSKLEGGETEQAVLSNVNLRKVVDDVINELFSEINKKNISIEVLGDGVVQADNKKIYEIVENLCSNAVNYNKENGKIVVEISKKGETILLKISDTGIGIEKENIPHLCERFYRVDKSRSKKTGGTGLGLAIVKHICALYNADLSIESQIGIGTTVSVLFK